MRARRLIVGAFDRLVDTGVLDRWRGRPSWLGRLILASDVRWIQGADGGRPVQ